MIIMWFDGDVHWCYGGRYFIIIIYINFISIKDEGKKNKRLANFPDSRMGLLHITSAGMETWEVLISQELIYRFQRCYLISRILTYFIFKIVFLLAYVPALHWNTLTEKALRCPLLLKPKEWCNGFYLKTWHTFIPLT